MISGLSESFPYIFNISIKEIWVTNCSLPTTFKRHWGLMLKTDTKKVSSSKDSILISPRGFDTRYSYSLQQRY